MIYITSRHLFLLLLKERSSQQSDAAGKEREASKSAHRYPIHDPWIYYGRCARKEEYAHTRIKRSTLLSCFCPNFCQIFKTKGWVIQKKNSLDTLGGGGTDNAIKVFLPLAAFSFYENLFFSIWSDSLFFSRSLATLLGLAGLQRSSCKLCVWSTSSLMRIDLHNPSREVPIYLSIYLSMYLQEAATTGRGWLLGDSPCASWQPRLPFASPEQRKFPTAARERWVGFASGAANPENYKGFSSWYRKSLHRTLWQLPVVSRKYPTISFASAMWVGSPLPTCSVPAGVSRLWKEPSSLLRLLRLLQCNN
jgi:hypothetical protein